MHRRAQEGRRSCFRSRLFGSVILGTVFGGCLSVGMRCWDSSICLVIARATAGFFFSLASAQRQFVTEPFRTGDWRIESQIVRSDG